MYLAVHLLRASRHFRYQARHVARLRISETMTLSIIKTIFMVSPVIINTENNAGVLEIAQEG